MQLLHGPMSAPLMGVLTCSSFVGQCQLLIVRGVTFLLSVAFQIRVLKCCSHFQLLILELQHDVYTNKCCLSSWSVGTLLFMSKGQFHACSRAYQHAVTFVTMLALLL